MISHQGQKQRCRRWDRGQDTKLAKVMFLSQTSLGTKHKTMLEARNGSGTIKAFPRAGVKGKGPINKANTGLQNKTFHCEICDVHVNSETQLKQVLDSGMPSALVACCLVPGQATKELPTWAGSHHPHALGVCQPLTGS